MLKNIIDQSLNKLKEYDPEIIVRGLTENPYLSTEVGAQDIRDKEGCGYYCWFPGFIELVRPKQIVELGGAMGVGCLAILNSKYKDFKLYSITLEEGGKEFCYVDKTKYPNFHPIVGDDLNLESWPKDLDLHTTDIYFIDTIHTRDQLLKELNLYKPYFKEGSIVLFDDVMINPSMGETWNDIENILPIKEKFINFQLHWTGFSGVCIG